MSKLFEPTQFGDLVLKGHGTIVVQLMHCGRVATHHNKPAVPKPLRLPR